MVWKPNGIQQPIFCLKPFTGKPMTKTSGRQSIFYRLLRKRILNDRILDQIVHKKDRTQYTKRLTSVEMSTSKILSGLSIAVDQSVSVFLVIFFQLNLSLENQWTLNSECTSIWDGMIQDWNFNCKGIKQLNPIQFPVTFGQNYGFLTYLSPTKKGKLNLPRYCLIRNL